MWIHNTEIDMNTVNGIQVLVMSYLEPARPQLPNPQSCCWRHDAHDRCTPHASPAGWVRGGRAQTGSGDPFPGHEQSGQD